MTANRLNFTAKALAALPMSETNIPDKHKDEGGPQSNKALYLHVGKLGKVFYFVCKINGRTIRHRIGKFPATTIEQARKRCNELAADADKGINPVDVKRQNRQRGISLATAFEQYIEDARGRQEKPLRATTEANYRRSMRLHFDKWMTKPAEEIKYDMVSRWFKQATATSGSSANSAMRIARAVYNHQRQIAERQQSDRFRYNPFTGHNFITEQPRDTCIDAEDMPQWFSAVNGLKNETTRDYLLTLLFTGLRRRELAPLKWNDVDFKQRTLTVHDTKNGTDHKIPLSTFIVEILERRQQTRPVNDDGTRDQFVFHSHGASGYLSEPKKAITAIAAQTGLHCSPHGLRRTFSNFAAFEAGIHELARKRLLNHSITDDVTAKHYSVLRMPRLRRYQQEVTDSILAAANCDKKSAEILNLKAV